MRRKIPENERRRVVAITLSPEVHEWLFKQSNNVSRWIEELLMKVKAKQDKEKK
jgi:hypothetical protein